MLEAYISCNTQGLPTYSLSILRGSEFLLTKRGSPQMGYAQGSLEAIYFYVLKELLDWFDKQVPEDITIFASSNKFIDFMKGQRKVNKDSLYFPYFKSCTDFMIENNSSWSNRFTFTVKERHSGDVYGGLP
jgi:hypothetical protein